MTYRRCHNCALFYDKKEPACTGCGTPAYGFSKPLYTAKVNGNLNHQHRSAERERQFERGLR